MKRLFMLSALVLAAVCHAGNPMVADPTVINVEGTYYLLGTNGGGSDVGFPVYESTDLVSWQRNDSLALRPGNVFGTKWFWAPQIIKYNGGYMMFYTAEEQIAYAYADAPQGPYTGGDVFVSDKRMIDPFLFVDADGSAYLYHVRLDNGNNIYVAKMDSTFTQPDFSTLQLCIRSDQPWENTWDAQWPVAEGPTVLRLNGKYVMLYSSNDFRNPDYAVGIATADSPMGPWVKRDRPLLSRHTIAPVAAAALEAAALPQKLGKDGTLIDGTGHGDIFYGADNQMYYIFHIHNAPGTPSPRRTAIIALDSATLEPDITTFRIL